MKIEMKFFPRDYSYDASGRACRQGAEVVGTFGPIDTGAPYGPGWCGDGIIVMPRSLAHVGMETRGWKITVEFGSKDLRSRLVESVAKDATDEQLAAIATVLGKK